MTVVEEYARIIESVFDDHDYLVACRLVAEAFARRDPDLSQLLEISKAAYAMRREEERRRQEWMQQAQAQCSDPATLKERARIKAAARVAELTKGQSGGFLP